MLSLTDAECVMAIAAGVERQRQAYKYGRKTGLVTGQDEVGWTQHIEGAAGEMLVAKARNLYFDNDLTRFHKRGDIGEHIEVRTRRLAEYELMLREDDDPRRPHVLLTGKLPSFDIRGWVWGYEGMRDEFVKNHGKFGPAWFVPHDLPLHPFETLRDELCTLPAGWVKPSLERFR